jgi:hypothetical protein
MKILKIAYFLYTVLYKLYNDYIYASKSISLCMLIIYTILTYFHLLLYYLTKKLLIYFFKIIKPIIQQYY